MTNWAPATETELAMRDALRAGDQELYFRILARSELLLPLSEDAAAGREPAGWGTWSSGGRTHVLAFTSDQALRYCLAKNAGSARRISYPELARIWPNVDWWLAVDPGLPIEGYLPAWFVGQLALGDVRMPGQSAGPSRHRLERVEQVEQVVAARARATAAVPNRTAPVETAPVPQAPQVPQAAVRPAVFAPASPGPPGGASGTGGASGASGSLKDAFGHRGSLTRAAGTVPAPPAVVPSALTTPLPPAANPTPSTVPPPAPASTAPPAAVGGLTAVGLTAVDTNLSGPSFAPANSVEASLLKAAEEGSTDSFLSTLLLARVVLPLAEGARNNIQPGDPTFLWRTETIDDQMYVVVFTSAERLAEFFTGPVDSIEVKFVQLIKAWPGVSWSFAVNPNSPVGAKLPGAQIVALATWAADVGLGEDNSEEPQAAPAPPRPSKDGLKHLVMQKAVPLNWVDFYLERGYDRVCGFVHRANEVAHLRTPAELRAALGLHYPGSPFGPDDETIYVLRWPAHRPSLYRIPYGGQNEAAMRAMEGWVIQRAPFRGNGFAPGESADVIAEFKVDSVRLPHGAELWRIRADATEELVALLDADVPKWRRVGDS